MLNEEWIICCECGESFGLQEETAAVLRRSQQTVYCPWGHGLRLNRKADEQPSGGLTVIEGGKK